jgi:hypothetical protein
VWKRPKRKLREPSSLHVIDQKKVENVEYLNELSGMITNDARCTREIKSKVAMAEAVFNRKKALFTRKLDINLRKKLVSAEIWTLQKVDQKYLASFEMWYWRRTESIGWTGCMRNEEVIITQSQGVENYPKYNKKGRLIGLVTSCVGTVF